jgi:uncharacterized protein
MSEEKNMRDRQDEEKGKMTVSEAGQMGGEKVLEERGPEYYSEIGKKGGETRGQDMREKAAERQRQEGDDDNE